jgi:hypothetical protein
MNNTPPVGAGLPAKRPLRIAITLRLVLALRFALA